MKIIKQGKTIEELEAILKKTKRFECKICGCVFEADDGEYKWVEDHIYGAYVCDCPNCCHRAVQVTTREIPKRSV